MKKKLLFSILGMAAATSFGQGYIALDNYNSNGGNGGPLVTYGGGAPANGVSGPPGTVGTGLLGGWTAGIYFVIGTPSITDPAGNGMPNAALALGTGPGSTVQFQSTTGGIAGEFSAANSFAAVGSTVGGMITAEIVAYPTSAGSYANAFWRAHSAPFTMPTVANITLPRTYVGDHMQAFTVGIPEPSTLAFVCLIGGALLFVRRRRSRSMA
jgi:hypothetical protein